MPSGIPEYAPVLSEKEATEALEAESWRVGELRGCYLLTKAGFEEVCEKEPALA